MINRSTPCFILLFLTTLSLSRGMSTRTNTINHINPNAVQGKPIDGENTCELRLFGVQRLQGKLVTISKTKRIVGEGKAKSIKIIGIDRIFKVQNNAYDDR